MTLTIEQRIHQFIDRVVADGEISTDAASRIKDAVSVILATPSWIDQDEEQNPRGRLDEAIRKREIAERLEQPLIGESQGSDPHYG